MSKSSIKDPSIAIRPSQKLIDFIKTLDDVSIDLPANVLEVYEAFTQDKRKRNVYESTISSAPLTEDERNLLVALADDAFQTTTDIENCLESLCLRGNKDCENDSDSDIETVSNNEPISKNKARQIRAKQREKELAKLTLNLSDIKWLHQYLTKARASDASIGYLHELIVGSVLILPSNEIIERNPELEARCQRLRREQDDQRYRQMTKNVDSTRTYEPEETIAYQGNNIHIISYSNSIYLFVNLFLFIL